MIRLKWINYIILQIVIVGFIISGCAPSLHKSLVRETPRPTKAARFLNLLDQEVIASGARDRAYTQIEGFPYLRTNRYLDALKTRLDAPAGISEWLEAMRRLDIEAREREITNLPEESVKTLAQAAGMPSDVNRKQLIDEMTRYSDMLFASDSRNEHYLQAVIQSSDVPDDYSTAMRTFGLYPLVMPVVAYFSDGAFDTMRERNQTPPSQQVAYGEIVAYSLDLEAPGRSIDPRELFQNATTDAFGLPTLTDADKAALAGRFAPTFYQDVADEYDKIGEVEWEGDKIVINGARPAVYYYFSRSLFHHQPIWQINYVIWTSGRKGPHAPSIERGELDGITLRMSLDQNGEVFIVDGMNNCGCYHFFIPRKERLREVIPTSWEFDPVIIDNLPDAFPKQPLGVRLTSGWHQVEDVGVDLQLDRREPYRLIPYERLESLPKGQNSHAGLFDDEAVARGSDRIEIYIFFSMGIPRVGAMRQRGHHPTKLVGRAHFDDPYLLDKNFVIK